MASARGAAGDKEPLFDQNLGHAGTEERFFDCAPRPFVTKTGTNGKAKRRGTAVRMTGFGNVVERI
jgi:hypothetical protein